MSQTHFDIQLPCCQIVSQTKKNKGKILECLNCATWQQAYYVGKSWFHYIVMQYIQIIYNIIHFIYLYEYFNLFITFFLVCVSVAIIFLIYNGRLNLAFFYFVRYLQQWSPNMQVHVFPVQSLGGEIQQQSSFIFSFSSKIILI